MSSDGNTPDHADAGGLRVTDLSVPYGAASALSHVALSAPAGSITAVVGPNGAGKSSLLLGIYGSGTATGSGQRGGREFSFLSTAPRPRAGIAMVPQGRQLFPRLS